MIAVKSWKRIGLVAAAALACGIGALALGPFFFPADHVRDAVKAEIRAATGLDPVLHGDASISLFPSAQVSFGDLALGNEGNGGEPALVAEQVTVRLKILPLLLGRIEIAAISMVRPRITFNVDADGRTNWSTLVGALAHTLTPEANRTERLLSFSEVRLNEGTLIVRDRAHGVNETLTDVTLSLGWPSIAKSLGVTGQFVWRDETVDVSVTLSDLVAALAGDRSGVKLRLAGAPAKLAFDGHMTLAPQVRVEGSLSADSASLREAMQWAGLQPLPGGGFGRFALKAQAAVAGPSIALSQVNVELDGNAAEGVLALTIDGHPFVRGTLAANELDLTPYVSTVRLLRQNERDWSQAPIVLDGFSGIDFDLRLSAPQIVLATAKLGRTAVAATLRSGRMMITVGEFQAFGGLVKGSIALARAERGAELKAQLQFSDVDLEQCLNELIGLRRLEGTGDLTVQIEGSGSNVLAVTRTLNGHINLNARQGALAGLNLEQLMRRLERRPLSGGAEFRSGRTPFEKLNVALKIEQGTAAVESVKMEGAAVQVALAGSASIPARDLDLQGVASLITALTGSAAAAFDLPFVVQGPWDDPIMVPDPESLIRRSGTLAPLLEALKERKLRDARPSPTPTPAAEPAASAPSEIKAAQ